MRKLQYAFILLLFICFLLAGTTAAHLRKKPSEPVLVTQIRITGHTGTEALDRLYIQPEKTGTILNYLRWLTRKGSADPDPEALDNSYFDITLYYSDGETRVYRQRGTQYLSKNHRAWEKLDPEQGQYLLPILRAIPSDDH